MKRYSYFILWCSLLLIDQLSKQLAASTDKVFRNYNFAFSLPVPIVLMYILYAGILGVMVSYIIRRYRSFSNWENIAWTLVLAGSISNIAERIILGFVRDFIYLGSGVFNLADFFILFGIIILFAVRGKLKHAS